MLTGRSRGDDFLDNSILALTTCFWSITIDFQDWPTKFLCIALETEDMDGKKIWSHYGRINFLRISLNNDPPDLKFEALVDSHGNILTTTLYAEKFKRTGLFDFSQKYKSVVVRLNRAAKEKNWIGFSELISSHVLSFHQGNLDLLLNEEEKKRARLATPSKSTSEDDEEEEIKAEEGEISPSEDSTRSGTPSPLRLTPRSTREIAIEKNVEKSISLFGQGQPTGRAAFKTLAERRTVAENTIAAKKKKVVADRAPVPQAQEKRKRKQKETQMEKEQDLEKGQKKMKSKETVNTRNDPPLTSFHQEQILMSAKKADASAQEIITRQMVKRHTIRIDIDLVNPPERSENKELSPWQIRRINEWFVGKLTTRFEALYNPIAKQFILHVDPATCASPEEFCMDRIMDYRFNILGGNHSFLALQSIHKRCPHNTTYSEVEADVLVGCSTLEQATIAWSDNVDGEVRHKLSLPQRIMYIHSHFVRENILGTKKNFKMEIAKEVQLNGWGERPVDDVLQSIDNIFCLAYRTGQVWDLVEKILRKYEKCQLKGQESKRTKKKKGVEEVLEDPVPTVDMKISDWKSMQGVDDERILVPLLTSVVEGKVSISTMSNEFILLKMYERIRVAYCVLLGKESFSQVLKVFGRWVSETSVRSWYSLFSQHDKDMTKAKKKRRGRVAKDFVPDTDSFPKEFQSECMELLKKEKRERTDDTVTIDRSNDNVLRFSDMMTTAEYEIHNRDCLELYDYVKKRPYTLCIMDILYGFDPKGKFAKHDDRQPFPEHDLEEVVSQFSATTIAEYWRIIILHSVDQVGYVKSVLKQYCSAGVEVGCWNKRNCVNAGGARLNSQFELWTIGYGGKVDEDSATRSMHHYNFPDNSRLNHVSFFAVSSKHICSFDKEVLNIYQKPRRLMNWFIDHFSYPGDWVLDLFSGSRTTLLSALAHGRNCVSVEIDPRQAQEIHSRVLLLPDDKFGNRENTLAQLQFRKDFPMGTFERGELMNDEGVRDVGVSAVDDLAIVPFDGPTGSGQLEGEDNSAAVLLTAPFPEGFEFLDPISEKPPTVDEELSSLDLPEAADTIGGSATVVVNEVDSSTVKISFDNFSTKGASDSQAV